LALPEDLQLDSAELNPHSETNSVYFCRGRFRRSPVEGYLKIADRMTRALENERSVLDHIADTNIPVPSVLASDSGTKPFLFLAALPGITLWDLIDPRRPGYHRGAVLKNLRAYGGLLAQVHALGFDWADQGRSKLEDLIGEQDVQDTRFRDLVAWLAANRPDQHERAFIHGDFNTGNVLLSEGDVSGVLDWEFAGIGWKEYELAWALRARIHFLNSTAERDAILSGYSSSARYDADQLRWCEVLNYAHFAYWNTDSDPDYESFALGRAESAAES